MLFMKGNPSDPKCGFSRQVVALLNEENIQYGTFDILNDDEVRLAYEKLMPSNVRLSCGPLLTYDDVYTQVRQGLKQVSNWPTFPQLYVNGALIGGLDILKEMKVRLQYQQTDRAMRMNTAGV